MIGTNCYLVINEETKESVMVDPGAYPAKVKNAVKEQGLKLKAVLLTHAHFDHIMGLSDVMEDVKVPVYVEEADLPMMTDGESNLSSTYVRGGYRFEEAVRSVMATAGNCRFTVPCDPYTGDIHRVGCCYYMEQEGVLFSGDTLFQTSVGRSDFPGGSASALVRSVKEKLLVLPEETHVYPGHMEETTIGYEKLHNPFI